MMNSSALLQLQVKESQLKPTYENKRNFIIYITMISRGASGFRHSAARNSSDLTWTSLVLLDSLCVILPTGIWSVRWPPVAWDCHLPSLAVPTDRAFVGLNIHLSAPEKMQVDSLWPHMWWIVTGAQGMGSSGANSLGHTIEGHGPWLKAPLGSHGVRTVFSKWKGEREIGMCAHQTKTVWIQTITNGIWNNLETLTSDVKMVNK